jgi:hypothetical protein
MNIVGSVRHFYSPRLNLEVSTSFSRRSPAWSLSYYVELAFHSALRAACVDLQSKLCRRGEHSAGPDPHHHLVVIFGEECGATMLVDVLAEAVS